MSIWFYICKFSVLYFKAKYKIGLCGIIVLVGTQHSSDQLDIVVVCSVVDVCFGSLVEPQEEPVVGNIIAVFA